MNISFCPPTRLATSTGARDEGEGEKQKATATVVWGEAVRWGAVDCCVTIEKNR